MKKYFFLIVGLLAFAMTDLAEAAALKLGRSVLTTKSLSNVPAAKIDLSCLSGYCLQDGKCVPRNEYKCEAGYTATMNCVCEKDENINQTCDSTERLINGECVSNCKNVSCNGGYLQANPSGCCCLVVSLNDSNGTLSEPSGGSGGLTIPSGGNNSEPGGESGEVIEDETVCNDGYGYHNVLGACIKFVDPKLIITPCQRFKLENGRITLDLPITERAFCYSSTHHSQDTSGNGYKLGYNKSTDIQTISHCGTSTPVSLQHALCDGTQVVGCESGYTLVGSSCIADTIGGGVSGPGAGTN